MDFVEGLPKSAFMDNIYKLHGMPESIVTDRDRIFTSRFWREIAAPTGTKLKMSSSHHPQTDRQSERVNQCLEAFLRCFTHAWPAKWAQWLSLAEYWYNTSMHSSLQGKSPFETLYGHSPRQFGISDADACSVPELSTWLQDRALMLRLLQQHLERVRVRMKNQADKKRSDRVFQVGDSVFMRLQPHVQSSVAPRAHHKLLFKFYGPFKILERIGPSAYRLQLPLHSKIHPVLHVSQLKKALGPHCQLESLATWEDLEALKQRFPRAAAWGQAAFQGKGNVKARPWATTGDSPTNEAQEVVRLDKRLRQPAQRYTSDEWVK
ncbi:hypothetical protein ACQJBY_009639 [Aegilops geniculata]